MRWLSRRPAADRGLVLYYASDVHGSDLCWRKFLRAASFYDARCLVMGGDLTGKAVVPIAIDGDRFSASFLGERRDGAGADGLAELEAAIRHNGMYPWRAGAGEIAAHDADDRSRDALFERVLLDELRRWVGLADERLAGTGVELAVIAGNDDPWACDPVLRESAVMTFADDAIVELGGHELLSLSYANPTPWDSPRELPEDALYARIRALADQLERPRSAIFNLHVPPHDSGLDTACEIDAELRPVYEAGQPRMVPVGSRAVRQILEEFQPLLALHGHIHESRAEARIGRTLAINSGSEYQSGRLHGALVTVGADRVLAHQFVVG